MPAAPRHGWNLLRHRIKWGTVGTYGTVYSLDVGLAPFVSFQVPTVFRLGWARQGSTLYSVAMPIFM